MSTEIRKIRNSKSLNQRDFSKSLGISQALLSLVEAGKIEPSFKMLKGLRKHYKANINKMLDEQ